MKLLRQLEKAYVVVSMLFFSGGLIQRMVAEDDPAARLQPDMAFKIGQVIIYAILLPLAVVHWRRVLRGVQQSGWIFAMCGFAITSAAWAFDRRFTLLHGIIFSALTLFAIYLASCFDWEQQINLFGWLSLIAIVGSACMAIFVPAYGISQDLHQGAVKGLFPHKNIMGRQLGFAILTLWLGKPKAIPLWLRNSALACACLLLALSNAVTSIVAMLACVAMYPVFHLLRLSGRRTLPLWAPLVPVLGMGLLFGISNFGIVLEATGRSSTLTGRSAIWSAVLSAIGRHPWLGYGYDIFWNRYTIDLAKVKFALRGFQPPHAHNGYLDLLLAMGLLGMLVFVGSFLTSFWRAGTLFQANQIRGAKWPMLVLLFIAVFNVAESSLLRPLTFLWIPYVTIYVSLALMRAEERLGACAALPHDADNDGRVERESQGSIGGALPGYIT